ncbi:MAG: phage tail protein [Rhodocyclaceae bacterium]|nr:phage tail protein [Rhodocyclaceae bacterium]
MGGLFGGGGGTAINTSDAMIGAIRIQTSAYGQPVPLLWGKNRIAANLIWYGDFQAVPHTTTTSSGGGGGKGGGGGQVTSTNTTYTYQAAVAMGLCEGPVSAIGSVWAGKDQTDLATLGLSLFSGGNGQAPWGYLSANHPDEAVAYPQTGYVAGASYQLDSSAGLPNHSFEASGPLPFSGGIPDANPRDVIADYLANITYGVGFPTAAIGDLTQFSAYCVANGIFISPALVQQRGAQDILTEWAQLTNSQIVWSEGKFKLIPYGDQAATGNGATYTPNTTPIYDLTDDDFLPGNSDPVVITRSPLVDAFNQAQVEFCNRGNQYNVEIAQVQDQASVELFGLRPADVVQFHEIVDPAVASFVAQTILQRYLTIRNTYEFAAGWKYARLEPGDIVTITDVYLGLNKFPVRITQIEEDETGGLAITAEEFPVGAATATLYTTQIVSGYALSQNIAPGSVSAPAIFTPPNSLTAPNTEVWIAACGGQYWGGCEVWASQDNATYRKLGVVSNPARMGVLAASIAAGADPDTTHALAVDLTQSRGQLTSGSQADADNLTTLCWVDGELMSYQTATLTAQYKYTLGSYLRRGVKGTANTAHNAGAQFVRLDGAIFRYAVPAEWLGKPIYIKLPSFNVFGNGLESLAEVEAYAYTLAANKPASLASLTATGGMFENDLAWTFSPNQADRFYTEIWGSTTDNRSTATQLTTALDPVAKWKHTGLQPAQTWYYWGRVADTSKNTSDYYPAGATAGVACAPSANPSALLAQLEASIGVPQLAADLAAPILQIPDAAAAVQSATEAALNLLLKADELKKRAITEKWVTDATTTIDPATGKVTLLATAAITTDVEAQLNSVQIQLGAMDGSIVSHTETLTAYGDRLTADETDISQLQGEISLKADSSYVDSAVAGALGVLDPAAVSAASQAGAEGLLQALLDANAGRLQALGAVARVASAELTIKTTTDAVTAEATERLILAAQVGQTAAALDAESAARATADGAQASMIDTLTARLNTGDYAAVKTQAIATADALGGVSAEWGVQVQTMADGTRAVAGLTLLAGTDGESVFAVVADKLVIYQPDGTGVPKQIVTLGTINGAAALGLDGNLIVDGSVTAKALSVTNLSAIKADLGTVTAGRAQNAANTNYIDFNATGAAPFLKVGSNVTINADGSATLTGVVLSRQLAVGSGSYNAGSFNTTFTSEYTELAHWDIDTAEPLSAWAGANATYLANAGMSGTVYTNTGTQPDVYWGIVCTVLPLTVWSGAQVIRLRLSLWGKHVVSVSNCVINWSLYKVT